MKKRMKLLNAHKNFKLMPVNVFILNNYGDFMKLKFSVLILCLFSNLAIAGLNESLNICANKKELFSKGSIEKKYFNALERAREESQNICNKELEKNTKKGECDISCKGNRLSASCTWELNLLKVPVKPVFDITITNFSAPKDLRGEKITCGFNREWREYRPTANFLEFNCRYDNNHKPVTIVTDLSQNQKVIAIIPDINPNFLFINHNIESGKTVLVSPNATILTSKDGDIIDTKEGINNYQYIWLKTPDKKMISIGQGLFNYFEEDSLEFNSQVIKGASVSSVIAGLHKDEVVFVNSDHELFVTNSTGTLKEIGQLPNPQTSFPLCEYNSKFYKIQEILSNENGKTVFFANNCAQNTGFVKIDQDYNLRFYKLPIKEEYKWSSPPLRLYTWEANENSTLNSFQITSKNGEALRHFELNDQMEITKTAVLNLPKDDYMGDGQRLSSGNIVTCNIQKDYSTIIRLLGNTSILAEVRAGRFRCGYNMVPDMDNSILLQKYNSYEMSKIKFSRNGCQYDFANKD